MTVILLRVKVPVLSEQMCVAPPMVSDEASFLTRLLSYRILADEKDRDRVTARGRPSGIATTIMVIAIIIVVSTSFQSLFSIVSSKLRGTQLGSSWQLKMF